MTQFKSGDEVGIRCAVQPGPFSGEKLISFDTLDGPVTGFVKNEYLRQDGDTWLVHAVVVDQQSDTVRVNVHGSFFTTNGLATIPREMALAA